MDQNFINILIALIGAAFGWVFKIVWESLRDLRGDAKVRDDRIGELEVLVAGKYISREDFGVVSAELFRKLDAIRDKLDSKADRIDCDQHRRANDK